MARNRKLNHATSATAEPFGVWLLRRVLHTRRLFGTTVATVAVIAALPMLVHGYLIIFRGSRLF